MKHFPNPLTAIKLHCVDCCCGSASEARLCPVLTCNLHAYRNGRNPHRMPRNYTPEQKAAMTARLQVARTTPPANCGNRKDGTK